MNTIKKTILNSNNLNSLEKTLLIRTIAALDGSRELAYLSTASDVNGLNCRVRNESGCCPVAMAAIETETTGCEPDKITGLVNP